MHNMTHWLSLSIQPSSVASGSGCMSAKWCIGMKPFTFEPAHRWLRNTSNTWDEGLLQSEISKSFSCRSSLLRCQHPPTPLQFATRLLGRLKTKATPSILGLCAHVISSRFPKTIEECLLGKFIRPTRLMPKPGHESSCLWV